MAYATVVFFLFRLMPGLKDNLQGFQILWGQLLSVTTFTLTFFLNQSYALWRKCYELSRRLQGRLNDLGMTLAAHAARKTPSSPSEPATYTNASRQLLELMGRYIRLFNLLTYASFTRSHRPILTPRGMRRLVERGLMTPAERLVLVEAEIPATQRHNAVMLWIIRCFLEGRNSGHIAGGAGFEQQFLEKIHVIRAQYGGIGDELQGRMPLAYAHIVQVLVDVILWMYPVMAFSTGMAPFLGIIGTGLLTMSYQGLFDLAKQFLDPYDNENYGKGDDPLCVDTLVAETNSGSVRWMNGFDQMPFSAQRIKDGELFDYQLPVRGYSVEELSQMEEERIQKELDLQEKRDREEAERVRAAEAEMIRQMVSQIINATGNTRVANYTQSQPNGTLVEPTSPANTSAIDEQPVVQDKLIDIVAETEKDYEIETRDQGHRVISLGDGTPITLIKENSASQRSLETKLVPPVDAVQNNQTKTTTSTYSGFPDPADATLAATISVSAATNTEDMAATESKKAADSSFIANPERAGSIQEVPVDVTGVYPDMMLQPDFGFFNMNNVQWFDEMRDDGQEYRLSQMMADEEWEEERRHQEEQKLKEPPMSYEKYRESVADLIEAVADELQETRDILSGSELEAKRSRDQIPVKYDQTKLDGISQLWGLPPSDPSALYVIEEPTEVTYEENSFDMVMQLWGRAPAQRSQEEGSIIGNNFNGISGLWDSNSGRGIVKGGLSELPWMNEVDSDGKEFRLSQLLANEVWEEYEPPVVEAPLSLEDYSKKVNEKYQDLEDEWKETVAILNAPPGADYSKADVGTDEKSEKSDGMRLDLPPVDATSEIRAEVQAAYVAAKQEEALIEQQLETLSKTVDDPLAILFDDAVEELDVVINGSPTEVHGNLPLDIEDTEMVDETAAKDDSFANADNLETLESEPLNGEVNDEG